MFNAFVVLSLAGVVGSVLFSNLPQEIKIGSVAFFFLWVLGITVWINRIAQKDPRSIAYGPNEYLEESRLAHERQMAAMRSAAQTSAGQP